MEKVDIYEEVKKAVDMLLEYAPSVFMPFFKRFKDIKVRELRGGICATDKDGYIYVNPEVLKESMFRLNFMYVVAHEFFHHIFESFHREEFMPEDKRPSKSPWLKDLWNFVTDAYINEMLMDLFGEYCPVHGKVEYTPQGIHYASISGKTAEKFFESIGAADFNKLHTFMLKVGINITRDVLGRMSAMDCYLLILRHGKNIQEQLKTIKKAIEGWHDEESDKIREAGKGEEGWDIDKEEAEEILKRVAQHIKEIEKEGRGRGYGKGDFSEYIENWVESSQEIKRLDDVLYELVLRKRQEEEGRGPDVEYMAVRGYIEDVVGGSLPWEFEKVETARPLRIVLIVDTSGSMSGEDISLLLSAMENTVKRHYIDVISDEAPIEIVLIQADADVQDVQVFRTWEDFERNIRSVEIKGRGGTDFTEGLRKALEFDKADIVLYLTDGAGGVGEETIRLMEEIKKRTGKKPYFVICPEGDASYLAVARDKCEVVHLEKEKSPQVKKNMKVKL